MIVANLTEDLAEHHPGFQPAAGENPGADVGGAGLDERQQPLTVGTTGQRGLVAHRWQVRGRWGGRELRSDREPQLAESSRRPRRTSTIRPGGTAR